MKNYDITILIHPNQSETINDIIKRYKSMIESNQGLINNFEDLGKKQLSYQIQKGHKAHYIFINIFCNVKTINNLASSLRFNDAVMRSIIKKK